VLSPENLNTLRRAFSFADHEFINGFVYISEAAITERIEEVDPSWSFELRNMIREGDQCVCYARLTISDVTREGVGMQTVITNKDGKIIGEAEKGAATDALKRCARLFGIGRYLLSAPKEGKPFEQWLAGFHKSADNPQPVSKSERIFEETATGRDQRIQDAVTERTFICSNAERKTKGGKEWIVFYDDTDADIFATSFSREQTTGLKDAVSADQYTKLGEIGLTGIDPVYVTWIWGKDQKFRNVINVTSYITEDIPF